MVSCCFFFVFAYGSELGMWEAMTTGLRERQRPYQSVSEGPSEIVDHKEVARPECENSGA